MTTTREILIAARASISAGSAYTPEALIIQATNFSCPARHEALMALKAHTPKFHSFQVFQRKASSEALLRWLDQAIAALPEDAS